MIRTMAGACDDQTIIYGVGASPYSVIYVCNARKARPRSRHSPSTMRTDETSLRRSSVRSRSHCYSYGHDIIMSHDVLQRAMPYAITMWRIQQITTPPVWPAKLRNNGQTFNTRTRCHRGCTWPKCQLPPAAMPLDARCTPLQPWAVRFSPFWAMWESKQTWFLYLTLGYW